MQNKDETKGSDIIRNHINMYARTHVREDRYNHNEIDNIKI